MYVDGNVGREKAGIIRKEGKGARYRGREGEGEREGREGVKGEKEGRKGG